MDKRKLKIALSLAVLIPCVLYAAGIIAQFIINVNAWKAAGSDIVLRQGFHPRRSAKWFERCFTFQKDSSPLDL